MSTPYFIGIAGGSGSGKTYFVNRLFQRLGTDGVVRLPLDAYYKDLSHLSLEERARQNFDHPDAIDLELLVTHLNKLSQGKPIQKPCYDFCQHIRLRECELIANPEVVLVEGILALYFDELRPHYAMKIFVEAPADLRLARRIERDVRERGRTLESILLQYQQTVRPMHERYVEPCRQYADLLVPGDRDPAVLLDLLACKVQTWLSYR